MFSLVEFDNGDMYVYPSSKVQTIEGAVVTVSHKGRGKYRARLLCENIDETFLNNLKDDIENKRLYISITAGEYHSFDRSFVRKCLFEQNTPQAIPNDSFEQFNQELENNQESSLSRDYEIIEKIYDKNDQDIDSYDHDDSGSEWLPDEEQEQEQWDVLFGDSKVSSISSENASTYKTEMEDQSSVPGITSIFTSVIVEDYRCPSDIVRSISTIPVVLAEAETSSSSVPDQPVQKKISAKKHSCLFCGTLVVNLPRHLRSMHMEEESVKAAVDASTKFLQGERNPKYRNHTAFEELRKRGDHHYNYINNCENIIPVRNSPKPDQTSYVCCPLCKGFYSHKSFKGHFRNCRMRTEKKDLLLTITNAMGEARVNGRAVNKKASPELIKYFFPYFTKPAQAEILFKDDTAVEYGNKLVTKYYRTNAGGKHHIHIASQLRLLADIFINAKVIDTNIRDIADLLHPKHYDNIIKAIQLRCGYNNGIFKSPTTASNCCTLLLKVSKFLKCEAIKRIDNIAEKRYANFEYLLANSQNHDITRQAQDNKTQFQRQKKEILPSTEEINGLLKVLDIEVTSAYEKACSNFDPESYTALAKASLAYLLVFNRKRPGDVEKTQLLEIRSMARVDQEHLLKLPGDDKKHAEQFARYITQGKLNKKASNLIPKKVEQAIDLLVQKRNEIGIPTENQYLFARIGSSSTRLPYFKADEALKLICQRNELNYNRLNANKLRKHLATCTAMLSSNVQNIISDFMGHTMAVHQNVYQQKQAHTDIVVMGKVLLEASGVSQNDNLAPVIPDNNDPGIERLLSDWRNDDVGADLSSAFNEQDLPGSSKTHLVLDDHETLRDEPFELSTILEESNNNVEIKSESRCEPKRKILKTISIPRRTWRTPEKREIRNLFKEYIQDLKVPPIHEVQDILVNKAPHISRNITKVRSWIHAEINRIKKQRCGIRVQRWTTPERHKVRDHFRTYFDGFKETFNRNYPSNEELNEAIKTIPEFKNKSAALLRSKIQHEFRDIERLQHTELEAETSFSSESS
ncbi:unnamed protein product [Phaedon cochleariae]|uniref:Uncharacterized protein n=1 Tax=Phaedon cochleariae TaxID=80249 RepID=A0A9P0DND5_PHACE|nr:unnamed protein product [Phaedon cochleariae]